MELVYIIIYALVHGLDPAADVHLPLELAGLVAARQPLQLADQGVALLPGDEAGGLHHVHQQLQLRQLKLPPAHEPARGPALPALHVQAEQPQGLQIVVDALPLRPDAPQVQFPDQLGDGDGVLLVGALEQDLIQIQQFQLLIGTLRHGSSSSFR